MASATLGLPQVCNTFARWRQRGVRNALLALLRQQVRAKPSVAIIDSQSLKTVSKEGSTDMTQTLTRPRMSHQCNSLTWLS